MGDRVWVNFTCLPEHREQVLEIAENSEGTPAEDDSDENLCYLAFEEVNYGTLSFLGELRDVGIAYDSCWEAGAEFSKGTESCRFTEDGGIQTLSIYEGGENPSINQLIALIDQPQALRAFILQHQADTSPLPWDNQVEYGKRYLAKQMLTS